MTHSVRLLRDLRAKPENVYKAFLNADVLCKWLPPNGFTGHIHQFEAKVGGQFKMSFTNFASGISHSFDGEFLELVPYEKIRYTDKFGHPNLSVELIVTITLKKVICGT